MSAQADFAGGLLNPDHPAPKGLSDGKGRAAGRRYDVYRNNVTNSLAEALATGFPAVTRLIGEENMKGLARMHLRASPPTSPVLAQFGEGFPAFLASVEALAPYPYLPDVARLELALRRAYHAADSAPMQPECLAALPVDQLMAARIGLAPAAGLLRSAYPVHDIWAFTLHGGPKPGAGPQDVLIARPGYDPSPVLLPAGGHAFMAALLDGAPFGAACDSAEAAHPGFDPTDTLTLLLTHDAITHIHGPDR
ncbi:MAG: DUF2063 domain-containing protein [Pseudooceanicola sp.]|jgi:hypothetical protein|nr:DUF2063 domain-containing protein [Pseudooceanicola sp.]